MVPVFAPFTMTDAPIIVSPDASLTIPFTFSCCALATVQTAQSAELVRNLERLFIQVLYVFSYKIFVVSIAATKLGKGVGYK